jgi:hypothetical protein
MERWKEPNVSCNVGYMYAKVLGNKRFRVRVGVVSISSKSANRDGHME